MSYPIQCDGCSPIVVTVRSWGKIAAALFDHCDQGTVIAVFKSSFYCRFGDRLICIGCAGFPQGPLNIETSRVGDGTEGWRDSGVTPGGSASLSNGRLRVGDVVLSTHRAAIWRPPSAPRRNVESLRHGATLAAGIAATHAPTESLAALGRFSRAVDKQSPVLAEVLRNETTTACIKLEHWLVAIVANAERRPPEPEWTCLIGLGRGLTPSGDDLIGGALVTLAVLGAEAARHHLAEVVCREMESRTSPISAAHLRLAASGQGGAALHDLIIALMFGEAVRIRKAVAALELVGHTSGWDMLAGVLLAARVICETKVGYCCEN